MAWSDAARAAALETRRANAKAKPQPQQRTGRKPGPQTAAHPNPGQRVAFAVRNKLAHDAGKDARIAAYNARQAAGKQIGGAVTTSTHVATGGRMSPGAAALIGTLLGLGGSILHGMAMKPRGGNR
jgi:hypothetical protein